MYMYPHMTRPGKTKSPSLTAMAIFGVIEDGRSLLSSSLLLHSRLPLVPFLLLSLLIFFLILLFLLLLLFPYCRPPHIPPTPSCSMLITLERSIVLIDNRPSVHSPPLSIDSVISGHPTGFQSPPHPGTSVK